MVDNIQRDNLPPREKICWRGWTIFKICRWSSSGAHKPPPSPLLDPIPLRLGKMPALGHFGLWEKETRAYQQCFPAHFQGT